MQKNNKITNRPLLSIVVPTKNRYNCLKVLVELFISFNSKDIELVISDNSDDNSGFLAFLKTLDDKRIKYIYTSDYLSVVDNSDRAILASTGEYINMIGDDDGNQREIIDVVRYMKRNDIESLNCYRCQYLWPGVESRIAKSKGTLKIKQLTMDLSVVDVKEELDKVLHHGACISYQKLPCVYNGIVRRDVLDIIYSKTGTFFPGPSPDMANAIALSTILKKHYWLDYPISWAGINPNSGGGMGAAHRHSNKIDECPWLPQDASYTWDTRLPYYWTGCTVWAESAIKALTKMGDSKFIKDIDFGYIYGVYFALSPNNVKHLIGLWKTKHLVSIFRAYVYILFERFKALVNNIVLVKVGKSIGIYRINGIDNSIKCENYIHEHIPFRGKGII